MAARYFKQGLMIALIAWSCPVQKVFAQSGSACSPYANGIKIAFDVLDPEPSYTNSLNVTSMQNFLRTRGHVFSGRHQRTLGVTTYQSRFAISGRTYAVPVAGGYCVYLKQIDVAYGYVDHDVYIASEFPPESCEYNAIFDHENQHVAINRAALRQGARQLRQDIEQRLKSLAPKFTKEPQVGTDRTLTELQLAANPMIERIEQAQAARNAQIDTAGNYDAVGTLCKDWDRGTVWPKTTGRKASEE